MACSSKSILKTAAAKDLATRLRLTSLPRDLAEAKTAGAAKKWASSNLEIRSMSQKEVQLTTRSSFATPDLYGDLVENARAAQQSPFESSFVGASAFCLLFGSIVIPMSPLPDTLRNAFGLLFIVAPFLLLLLSQAAPLLVAKVFVFSKEDAAIARERYAYHEAGHMLSGYLCGVAVTEYFLDGESDSATSLDPASASLGNLLVVSFSGMIAEKLRFGTCKGGGTDWLISENLCALARVRDKQGTQRWAVAKSLALLRLHREALDAVAAAMQEGAPVVDIYALIEETKEAAS